MNRKYVVLMLLCYLSWGLQPLYWNLYSDLDSLFLLAVRALWCAVFTVVILAWQKRLGDLLALFRNGRIMRFLVPGTVFLLTDWGVYTVAVRSGHILDSSLGYYLNPLVTFFIGLFLFREKCRWPQYLALGLAVMGVTISALGFGGFSWFTAILALAWAFYATFQKLADVDSMLSIAAETLILAPFMILFLLLFRTGDNGLSSLTAMKQFYLIGSGLVTALPMLLFSACVRKVPLSVMSFFQYLSPTFSIFAGLLIGETVTPAKWVSFLFIWAGIAVFTISTYVADRKKTASSAPV